MADTNIDIDQGITTGDNFIDTVPEAYREKPYMKGIDSMDKLWSQFDNAQSLIGKKTIGVPTQESTIEEWENFYNKMGRPEAPDKYEIKPYELPEEIKRTDEDLALMRNIFHKAGLTNKQAQQILDETDKAMAEYFNKNKEDMSKMVEARNNEFMQKLEKHFGAEKEQAIAVTETMLKKYTPKGMEDIVRGLDDKTMLALSAVLNNVHKASKSEDTFDKGGESVPTQTREGMREEAKRLMMSPEWRDQFHPLHESTKKKVNDLYTKIATSNS